MQYIIDRRSIEVNTDELYAGLGCHGKGLHENRYCCRCRRHAERRMRQALAWIAVQGTRPVLDCTVVVCSRDAMPMPAEAADYVVPPDYPDTDFDGFLHEPSPRPVFPAMSDEQLRRMAFLNAVEDFELAEIDA